MCKKIFLVYKFFLPNHHNVMQNKKPTTKPSKKPRQKMSTETVMTELVLPTHTNALGTIFGGQVMAWIDIAAAIAATKFARTAVVTVSIDAIHFKAPIKLGQIVYIKAKVNYVGRTSMEVGVRVDAEDPKTGECVLSVKAYTTFVALNNQGKPTEVPKLLLKTSEEKRRHADAVKRSASRMKLAKDLKQ